ncbi:flagellar motor protein MotB [Bacillus sp. FJAT-49736]|uniref:flagellar motor protein MotB n=1 Tax=Bacillus sp. FJAT-49736 TaxID=2833582 RepID=UPI001BC910D2|nr:flagellar motor protein MotB [Bacillus sp. FJAT-49736]MBS4175035.1 flagellar motor protein MotB [Bacillus sp. FJAT-49736]
MSRRKKKHDDSHIDEAWLLPYADILTLLLALFIVLFSISSVDAQKLQELSKVFNGIFASGNGVLNYTKPAPQDSTKTNEGMKDQVTAPDTKVNNEELKKLQDQDKEELKELQARVNAYIKEKKLEGKFATSLTDEGLLLTIRDNVLFGSGRADIRHKDVNTAKELSNLLVMDPPRNIMISGHTDNVPIHNANFQSNWELSVMRAMNFMKLILENKSLDPKFFSIKGYGEFKPIASNGTAEGRAKNRRVEVLIMPRVNLSKQ